MGRIKTLPHDDSHFHMPLKENQKHIYKQQQKTPLTIKEAQTLKKTHKFAMKKSSLLFTPQSASSLD
jgi:hypothetical protein